MASSKLPGPEGDDRMTTKQVPSTMARIFGKPRGLIGMIHVGALPGTPAQRRSLEAVTAQAVAEAQLLTDAGFDGMMIENMHDRPYLKRVVGPEIVAAMACIGQEVKAATPLPLGVQVLAGANQAALAVALAVGASFVRVEGALFAHVADEGWMDADAGELLRYRRQIGADRIAIFADIKKKHSAHAVTADVDLVATARAAEFFLADGVIVTAGETGQAAAPKDVEAAARAIGLPTLVGSGVTADNVGDYPRAAGLIVGSCLKEGGRWNAPMDIPRLDAMKTAFDATAR
ncbi:MAG: BtpA family membrane complex biogenesis protein [Deltaproteobacteria bacterium]|nr:MAG: BtpA family membrane complex biogenesis protein [Deltaproteobacteria bacterium]